MKGRVTPAPLANQSRRSLGNGVRGARSGERFEALEAQVYMIAETQKHI